MGSFPAPKGLLIVCGSSVLLTTETTQQHHLPLHGAKPPSIEVLSYLSSDPEGDIPNLPFYPTVYYYITIIRGSSNDNDNKSPLSRVFQAKSKQPLIPNT